MNVSRIYLLNVSEEVRSELNGVKYESVEYIENLMKCDTISFTVDKYIDIDGTYVDSNYYDQIKESMYVYVSNLNNSNENNDGSTLYKNRGLFRISEVSISNNGHNESKSVTCESSECELGNQSLFGFKINTGELDSAEYLADDNVDEATKLAIEYVTFYNANNSQLSLLDLAIEKVPYWSIGYVDPLLRNKKFSFSIDNKPIYSFLINELSSTAQCVFTFDTINRTINAYSISRVDALGDTNIFVSYRNLLNSTNITRSDMDLVTRFNVSGSDNLSIARVNFDEPYIENLTHLLSDEDKHDNPIYSNSGLRDKYLAWYSYRYGLGGARDTFVQKVKKYNENIVALDELKNKLPVDALDVNQYKDFDKETLQNLLANYMSIINAMVVDFAAYYDDGTMVVDENGFAVIDDQQGLEESIYWEDYQLYKNILIPNIKVAIQNCDLDEEHQLPYNTNYETDWDLYGIVELENKIKVYKQNIDVLKEAGYEKAWSDLTPAEKAKWEQATYNIYHQQYLDYLDLIDDAEDALHDRRVDYQGIENEQDLLLTQIATIKENASIENPNFGFTQTELLTIYKLRRDTDYLNDNILSTSDDDIVSQIDDMNELFEAAMDELDIVSQHQYKLSATLDNLFNLEAFQGYKKDLKAGNFIKMFLREADEMTEVNYGLEDSSPVGLYTSNDDKPMLTHERYSLTPNIVKLRVTSIKRNPCLEDDNSLTLEFSNMIRDKDGLSDYTNLFKSAVNSAFNQINATVKQKLDYTNVAISNSIIKALVSSSALGKRINSLIADTIQAKDGIFDTVQSQYISTDEFEARLARVQSLSASSAFFQFMETNFATVHELDVEVARIDTLVASDANIRNILAGNIGTGSLQTIHLTGQNVVIDDAIITSAMIQGLSASKILAGTIYTSLVKIANDQNENLLIDGATIQIKDSNNTVRVQIGRDAGGDYNYSLWNENGDLMWDAAGIYETGIHDGVIKDIAVADDANINAKKLDLPSLVTRLNEDGSLTVQTSQIIIDEAGQTFEARFKEITSFVDNYNNKTVMVVPLEDVNGNPLYDSNGNLLYVEVKLKDFDFLAYTNYIKEQMDSRIETWYQSTDPSLNWNEVELAEHKGDLWFNTTNNTTWRWNGTSWSEQSAPDAVFDAIDGKAQIFIAQPTVPYNEGDLWFDSATSDIMTCVNTRTTGNYTASDWQKRNKYTDDSSLTTFISTTYATQIQNLQGQIDGKIQTWYQDTDPSTAWTTSAIKNQHIGDLWYVTNDVTSSGTVLFTKGDTYRYDLDNNVYKWMKQSAPQEVFDKIDGKAQIFISQPTTPYHVGDLWFNSTTSDIMTCTTERLTGNYNASDWEKRNKYTDDTAANAAQSDVNGLKTRTTTLETDLAVVQGQITSKVWQTDIDSAIDDVEGEITTISDNYTTLVQRVDGIDIDIGSIQTTLATKADSSTVTTLSTQVTTISSSLDGIAVRVGTAESTLSNLGTRTSSLETDVGIIQGQITSKVWQTDIDEATNDLGEQITNITNNYSTIIQNVDGIQTIVGEIQDIATENNNKVFKYVELYDYSNNLIYSSEGYPLYSAMLFKEMDMPNYNSGIESSIKQNADNIELKVNKNGIIAAINLSSEQASINAEKINLHGYTTINNYFKIDTNGKLIAVDGDFAGKITAEDGSIGNWSIGQTSIYSGSAVWKNANGMYFGQQGLSLSDQFFVDNQGNMTANSATIKGRVIADYLELGDGVTINSSRVDGLSYLLQATAEGIESKVQKEFDEIKSKKMLSAVLYDSAGYKMYDSSGYLFYGTESFEEVDMSDVTNRMWTSIIQNADNIELKVSKNGIISAINLSSEQATIQASKISLEGLTTINNYFKVLTNGKMECIGGTIAGWTIDSNAIWRNSSTFNTDNGNNVGMYFGVNGLSIGHDKFNVTSAGLLNATGATISGSITATSLTATQSGRIANWDINSSCLYYNNSTFKNANGIYLGTSGISVGDVFYVDKTNGTAYFKGSVNATSLTLGAGAIDYNSNIISNKPNLSQYLTQSDLNGYVTTQDLGDYVKVDITRSGSEYSSTDGTKTRSFKVSKKGLLEAENAIIRGTIYAGAGEIGALSINQYGLTASQDYYDEYYRSCNITTEIQPGSISIRHYDEYHRMYPYIFTISGERVYMHDIECISINPTEEIGYVDCSDIRMTNALHMGSGDYDVQAISYNTSGYMYFGANSSYTTTSVLRGTSVNIYSHSNGVTIGSSGDGVYLVGSVYENGTLLSSKYGKAVSVSSSSSSVSLTKETYNSGSFSVSKNGYTPLGIVGYEISGSRSNYMNLYRHYISGTTYYWSIRNNSSDTVSDTLTVYVLYSKN